ncbi:MAG: permease-like cell division protein FtsX [Cyclobacteriaceae bacterium]|jgi:cell division transport system permease protein|nr:permease-like cell division protein FtsX [Cyclobacteriaceae bacterium]
MEPSTRKKKLGGYPATGVVISTTLALVVIGLFGMILIYSNRFEAMVRENVVFKVYTRNGLSETQLKQVEQALASREFVADDANAVVFVSREEAVKDLSDLAKYKDVLGDNPFRDMFEVKIAPAFHDTTRLDSVKSELENMSGVFEAVYEKDFLEDVNRNFRTISLFLIGIDAILLVTVILLINNTMRLALFSQRFLIRSMQLVGARSSFIQRPFLVRAALYGLLAGIIAAGLIYVGTQYAYGRIVQLEQLHDQRLFFILLGSLLVIGALIAVISTFVSIRRYLKMSLDELY